MINFSYCIVNMNISLKKDNYTIKIYMVKDILKDVENRRQKHFQRYSKYRKINTLSKGCINACNAISVCSIILTFTPVSNSVMFVALAATSVSGVYSAVLNSFELEHKINSHNTSYLQYTDIHRDISARIRRNNLNSEDLDILLAEINSRLGLIEDQSMPVSVSIIKPRGSMPSPVIPDRDIAVTV